MKFSENWLRTFVNPSLSSEKLARALTMAGLEVESLEPVAPGFTNVVVGQITAMANHPNADRLRICTVDAGQAELLQIVCGAPNAAPGIKAPCALPDAALPGLRIGTTRMRGVESRGMLCSERELGLAEQSEGLMLLPDDAPVGEDLRKYLDLDDRLFTLKLTPNRSDCLSVLGVAREVSAITASTLSWPEIQPVPATSRVKLGVRLIDPEGCPRYCGRVIHIENPGAATPAWMERRLIRSGLRPICAVVDVTNYVMLELGQPLHAFDLRKLDSDISVRFAKSGESLTLLNQQTIPLDPDFLVIADQKGAVALAGIMGGEATGVSDSTRDIFLESAFFSPSVVAACARRLGLDSDAAYRFERGVDFGGTRIALERATELILGTCGGKSGEITEALAELPRRKEILLRPQRVHRMLGIVLDGSAIASLFQRLRFQFRHSGGAFHVTPPSYRFDLTIEADLIEELARLHGYEEIPAAAPTGELRILPQRETQKDRGHLAAVLLSRGYQEVVTYSFVEAKWEEDFAANAEPVSLRNPISSQMAVMRSTLAASLVNTLRFNVNRKHERVRIFEFGRCFRAAAGDGYAQPERLGGLCWGPAYPEQWGMPTRVTDFFDVKADVEALCHPAKPAFSVQSHPALHPGRVAEIRIDGIHAGWMGELHPRLIQEYELPSAPVLFELELAAVLPVRLPVFSEPSRFPPVRRDLALIVREALPVQILLDTMQAVKPPFVTEISLFDVYRGPGIQPGTKSLAFRIVMQDPEKTLTEEQIDAAVGELSESLMSRFDAQPRR